MAVLSGLVLLCGTLKVVADDEGIDQDVAEDALETLAQADTSEAPQQYPPGGMMEDEAGDTAEAESARGITSDRSLGPIYPLPTYGTESDDIAPWDYQLLEQPGLRSGWYAAEETAFIIPRIKSNLNSGPLNFGAGGPPPNAPSSIALPFTGLGRTVMPTFEIGYRQPGGLPAFRVAYRFLNTDGSGTLGNFDASGAGALSTHLSAQVLDLDSVFSNRIEDSPWYFPTVLKVTAGVRVAGTRFTANAQGATILDEFQRNKFFGAGPHAMFDLYWPIAATGFSIFTRGDVSGIIGTNRENFSTTVETGGGPVGGVANVGKATTGVAIIGARGGAEWCTDWNNHCLKFSAGYLWERWFFLGNDATSGNLGAELILKGPFIRGEFAY